MNIWKLKDGEQDWKDVGKGWWWLCGVEAMPVALTIVLNDENTENSIIWAIILKIFSIIKVIVRLHWDCLIDNQGN